MGVGPEVAVQVGRAGEVDAHARYVTGLVQLRDERRVEMLADVPDVFEQHVPFDEVPRAVGAGELVVVAAGDDGLQRQIRRRLEHDERGTRVAAVPCSSSMSTITLVVRCRVRSVPSSWTRLVLR